MYTFDGADLSVNCVPIFINDDNLLICGSNDGYLYFWDTFKGADETLGISMDGGNFVFRRKIHSFPIRAIAVNQQGNIYLLASNAHVINRICNSYWRRSWKC